MLTTLKRYLGKLAHLSPASVYELLSAPGLIPMRVNAPAPLDPIAAALRLLPDLTIEQATQFQRELLGNHVFFDALNRAMFATRERRIRWTPWNEFLYITVRSLQPRVMIETGVFDGQSSAVTLLAMQDNDAGLLVSIDLPATDTISGSTHLMRESSLPMGRLPGWLIPDSLRARHRLELGDARELLPRFCREYHPFDIFMHDSLHTHEHMSFEYMTAWPHLRAGGLLLSDDIMWNAAFHNFCRAAHKRYVVVNGFGATCK